MGRLEKIVVLTVVFLIAVILGVSLNETDVGDPVPDPAVASQRGVQDERLLGSLVGETRAATPQLREVSRPSVPTPEPQRSEPKRIVERPAPRTADVDPVAAQAPPVVDARVAQLDHRGTKTAADELRERAGRPRLLNSAVKLEADDAEEAEAAGAAPILVRTSGLVATHDDQYMLYTWKADDTFTSVARAYYDDMARVRLLRLANEGRTERDLTAGDEILIPVFDPDATQGADDRAYTVAEGDTLSSIALKIYGDSSKYRKIFEANRDVLSDENTLALGQQLRIPR